MNHYQKTLWMTFLFLVVSSTQAQTPPESVKVGFDIIFNRQLGNCVTCHTLELRDKSGTNPLEKQGNFGPNLQGVGKKYTRQELTQWVTDARKIRPDTLMPPYGSLEDVKLPNQAKTMLSQEQIQLVVDALLTLN